MRLERQWLRVTKWEHCFWQCGTGEPVACWSAFSSAPWQGWLCLPAQLPPTLSSSRQRCAQPLGWGGKTVLDALRGAFAASQRISPGVSRRYFANDFDIIYSIYSTTSTIPRSTRHSSVEVNRVLKLRSSCCLKEMRPEPPPNSLS